MTEEQLLPSAKKLDAFYDDSKALHRKLTTIEVQISDLTAQNNNLQIELDDLKTTVNILE